MTAAAKERALEILEELQMDLDHELWRLCVWLSEQENPDKDQLRKDIKYIRTLFLREIDRVSEKLGLYEAE